MRFPVLCMVSSNRDMFVDFWDTLYLGYDEDFYRENISQPLTPDRIQRWFKWKNGSTLSAKKAKTILRYLAPEEQVTADTATDQIVAFLNREGGAIWRIFWLHLQHPARFPIYDQHVHRAMAFIQGSDNSEIPSYDPTKVRTYLGSYVEFFNSFALIDRRRVDRALWAFGKFLGSPVGKKMCRSAGAAGGPLLLVEGGVG